MKLSMLRPMVTQPCDTIAYSTSDREVVGSGLAGSGLSRSNRGPVALCTLGLGLLNPPSLNGW